MHEEEGKLVKSALWVKMNVIFPLRIFVNMGCVMTLNFHISRVATNVSCSSLMQNKNLRMLIFISEKI